MRKKVLLLFISCLLIWGVLVSCNGGGEGEGTIPAASGDYIVFAWNDLGMHCLNPTYDTAVILPPYNTIWAQVLKRDSRPEVVTSGITVTYRIRDNTTSYGKTAAETSADYAQFWDNAFALFGTNLPVDRGLNLVDADVHNGLSGTMVLSENHYQADGIPLTPVNDTGTWSPYQVAEITVLSAPGGSVLARTRATVPTSDELNCAKAGCHVDDPDPFMDILIKHDDLHATSLTGSTPVLCANGTCHTSPVLGQAGTGTAGYLSLAVHGAHASRGADCYDCHPGNTTRCMRSTRHTAADGNCQSCHGNLDEVASTIDSGRTPWLEEPKCGDCHAGMGGEDDSAGLYRNAAGHGEIRCPACHGSPHAMLPTSQASDGYQAQQYQGEPITIATCAVCHSSSKGEGSSEFYEEHGSGGRTSACNVCHTAVPFANTAQWPHMFQWTDR